MKVLGCKVSDDIYERFMEMNRPLSDILREAIDLYLKYSEDQNRMAVNHENPLVNRRNDALVDSESRETLINTENPLEQLRKKQTHFQKTNPTTRTIQQRKNNNQQTQLTQHNPVNPSVNQRSIQNPSLTQNKTTRLTSVNGVSRLRNQKTMDHTVQQSSIQIECPHCKQRFSTHRNNTSTTVKCPFCHTLLQI